MMLFFKKTTVAIVTGMCFHAIWILPFGFLAIGFGIAAIVLMDMYATLKPKED